MGNFVAGPMDGLGEFDPQGKLPKGGPGTYNGDDHSEFAAYRRTKTPNGCDEKLFDSANPIPEGEPDHF